jgi:hypothetical protein
MFGLLIDHRSPKAKTAFNDLPRVPVVNSSGYVVRCTGHGPTLKYYLVYRCAVPGHYAPYYRGYYRKGLRVRG